MNFKDKKLVLIIEGVVIFLFLTAVSFFYQAKMASLVLDVYRQEFQKANTLLEDSLAAIRAFGQNSGSLVRKTLKLAETNKALELDNERLKNRHVMLIEEQNRLEDENFQLREENESFEGKVQSSDGPEELDYVIGQNSLKPMQDKIRSLARDVDSLSISPKNRKSVIKNLKSIYKELSAIELALVRILQDEPLYRDKSKSMEKDLAARRKEIEKLKNKLTAVESRLQGQQEKEFKDYAAQVNTLAKENEKLIEAAKMKEQEVRALVEKMQNLTKEKEEYLAAKESLSQTIAQYQKDKEALNKEVEDLRVKLGLGAGQAAVQFQQELEQKEKIIAEMEARIAELTRKEIVVDSKSQVVDKDAQIIKSELSKYSLEVGELKDDLQEKDSLFLELNSQIENQLREMAMLREAVVKSKLDSKRAQEELRIKEDIFSSLKDEIRSIGEVNLQVKEYLEKAFLALQKASKTPQEVDKKDVKVEIDSVQPKKSE